jgi:hypothetical protein
MAYWGEGPASTFEQAVSITASIGVQLGRAGMGLRFVTDQGEKLPRTTGSVAGAAGSGSGAGGFEGPLLEALAMIRTSKDRSLTTGLATLRAAGGSGRDGDGLVVAVFGVLSSEELRTIASARRGNGTYIAVLVNARASGHAPPVDAEAAAALLRAAGWRVVTVRSAAELAGAWASAGEAAPQDGRDLTRGAS